MKEGAISHKTRSGVHPVGKAENAAGASMSKKKNPYQEFCSLKRPEVKNQHPEAKNSEILKILSTMWAEEKESRLMHYICVARCIWHYIAWHGTAWHGMAEHRTALHCMALHGTALHGTARH